MKKSSLWEVHAGSGLEGLYPVGGTPWWSREESEEEGRENGSIMDPLCNPSVQLWGEVELCGGELGALCLILLSHCSSLLVIFLLLIKIL